MQSHRPRCRSAALLLVLLATACTHYAGVMKSYERVVVVAGTEQPDEGAPVAFDLAFDAEKIVKDGVLLGHATASRAGTAEVEIQARAVDAVDPWAFSDAIFQRLLAIPFYLGFLVPLWSTDIADYGGDGRIGTGDRLLDVVHTLNPLIGWPGKPHEAGEDRVVSSRRERRPAACPEAFAAELVLRSHRGEAVVPVPLDHEGGFRIDLLPALERVWDDDLVGEVRVVGTATVAPIRNLAGSARLHLVAIQRLEPLEWSIACAADTRTAYERFARQHGNSQYQADIAARLKDLAWREARATDERPAYVAFAQAWPTHPRVGEARARIAEIDWQRAAQQDEPASYSQYLVLQPDGAHADAARRRIAELQLAHEWRLAQLRMTAAAYREFAAAHPDAPEAAMARQRMAEFEQHEPAWLAVCKVGTAAAFADYKAHNPASPYVAAVDLALRDLAGRDLADLLDEGKVEVKTGGQSIQNVGVEVRRLVPYPVQVRIPVGTFFVCDGETAQNMVATGTATAELRDDEWEHVLVPSACANRPRRIPGEGDTFTVQRNAHSAELARLMAVLARERADYATQQAAVWIVTDDSSYADLGQLVSRPAGAFYGGTRVIGPEHAARAVRLCAAAGIDVGGKRILGDRDEIVAGLPEGDLRAWLAAQTPVPTKR